MDSGRINLECPNGTAEDSATRNSFMAKCAELFNASSWRIKMPHIAKFKRVKLWFWQSEYDTNKCNDDGEPEFNPFYATHPKW